MLLLFALFIIFFGIMGLWAALYASAGKRRDKKEALARIQRELARREAGLAPKPNAQTQD